MDGFFCRYHRGVGRAFARRVLLFFVAVGACFGMVGCKRHETAPASATPEVQVITLTARDVPIYQEWIGTLDGSVNAQIRAQVTGYLLAQSYSEGSRVKKGDLLFQIDPGPFQAALELAKAKLAQDQAQAAKTQLDVKRFTPLAQQQAISQQELDDATQADLAAQAQVKADQAQVDIAQLNLGFTRITAPIDGVAGLANGQIGDLVGPSSNPLTTVSTIDPVKVYFQVNEDSYLTYWRQFVRAEQGDPPPELQLVLSDGSAYPSAGRFFFADRQVNINTGTLQIVGLFHNPDYLLRPGQYARIRALTQTRRGALLVPQRAITELQGAYQVMVVEKAADGRQKAHLKPVKLGKRIGSDWLVESGVATGEQVVVEGLQKAKEGTEVNPIPFAAPAPAAQTANAQDPK